MFFFPCLLWRWLQRLIIAKRISPYLVKWKVLARASRVIPARYLIMSLDLGNPVILRHFPRDALYSVLLCLRHLIDVKISKCNDCYGIVVHSFCGNIGIVDAAAAVFKPPPPYHSSVLFHTNVVINTLVSS